MSSMLYALKHSKPEWQVAFSATSIHLGSLDTKILYIELFQNFFSHPSVSLSSFINLVAKVTIFVKLIMYVLSHGCLLNSYKAFFHLHTWSCHVTSLLVAINVSSYSMPSFHEKPCATNLALYPMMFPSTAWWSYELPFTYWYCILDIILLELVFHCSSEQVSSFFSCRRLCMRSLLQVKFICMVRDIS